MEGIEDNAMVHFAVKVRKDQRQDLDYLKTKGFNPAQLTRIGLDRELDVLRERGVLPVKGEGK